MTAERLMVAFSGFQVPSAFAAALRSRPFAGVTLFRSDNFESPEQVRSLSAALQATAPANTRPLLIGADQEGGQLSFLGEGATAFAGAMALGAAADEDLAERVARAIGRELHAVGVNVNYAPVCDLATEPANPALGIRSFGDEPEAVGRLAAATVRGLQSAGVAAAAKHFPGLGDAAADTHHGRAVVGRSRAELEQRELVPFRAALAAGARLLMTGHMALPALTGTADLPASLARAVVVDLLRTDLGFTGLTVTDALDMGAAAIASVPADPAAAALRAGQDLLLGTPRLPLVDLVDAPAGDQAPSCRLAALRAWLAGFEQPPLEVVGCAEHLALAAELARRSITVVRDRAGLLPLRLSSEARVLVIQPQPADLTPADTTALVAPTLAEAIRRRHAGTAGILASAEPAAKEIAAIRDRAADCELVVVGTDAAHLRPAQSALARALLALGRPTITVALRTPWDLATYPGADCHVCSFGILPTSTEALAAALFGEQETTGRLPVALGSRHPRGHGLRLGQAVAF